MPDPAENPPPQFAPADILTWLCDRLSPVQQRSMLRAMIARSNALLEPGVPPDQTATRVLEITPQSGVPFTFAVGVQVQDRDALQAVQQGSISGSLSMRPAIWLDATGEVPIVHVGAVCLIAGQTVATLVASPECLTIEIASHAFDRTLDLDEIGG